MKILILGTSNSILKKGWLPAFTQAVQPAEILNASIGGSPGSQFAGHLSYPLEDFDYVIFDTIPTDEEYHSFVGSKDYFERMTFQLLSSLASRSKLIILGFTQRKYLRSNSSVYEYQKALAAKIGAQFIDIAEMVRLYGNDLLPEGVALYEHRAHPSVFVSRVIGRAIGESLLHDSLHFPRTSQDYSTNFAVIGAQQIETTGEVVDRTNSLLQETFIQLTPGTEASVGLAMPCIGFQVNIGNSHGSVICHSEGTSIAKRLNFSAADRFTLKFVPLMGGFALNRITFASAKDLEEHQGRVENSPKSDDAEVPGEHPCVEISRLAFWKDNGESAEACSAAQDSEVLSRSVSSRVAAARDARGARIANAAG